MIFIVDGGVYFYLVMSGTLCVTGVCYSFPGTTSLTRNVSKGDACLATYASSSGAIELSISSRLRIIKNGDPF